MTLRKGKESRKYFSQCCCLPTCSSAVFLQLAYVDFNLFEQLSMELFVRCLLLYFSKV